MQPIGELVQPVARNAKIVVAHVLRAAGDDAAGQSVMYAVGSAPTWACVGAGAGVGMGMGMGLGSSDGRGRRVAGRMTGRSCRDLRAVASGGLGGRAAHRPRSAAHRPDARADAPRRTLFYFSEI